MGHWPHCCVEGQQGKGTRNRGANPALKRISSLPRQPHSPISLGGALVAFSSLHTDLKAVVSGTEFPECELGDEHQNHSSRAVCCGICSNNLALHPPTSPAVATRIVSRHCPMSLGREREATICLIEDCSVQVILSHPLSPSLG